jgi:hypothetical protein
MSKKLTKLSCGCVVYADRPHHIARMCDACERDFAGEHAQAQVDYHASQQRIEQANDQPR